MPKSLLLCVIILLIGCNEEPFDMDMDAGLDQNSTVIRRDTDSTIYISDDIMVMDIGPRRDTLFNYHAFESFLEKLVKSGRFLFVPLNELSKTTSTDKVIIALRHDIDYDITSSIRFARREYELGIRGSYYILHTAEYYCEPLDTNTIYRTSIGNTAESLYSTPIDNFPERKASLLPYLKKLQDIYHHEIGWHNDLVTLDVIYNINPGLYLKRELKWLQKNNIRINGTSVHGSPFCYKYFYLNTFFWKEYGPSKFFYNYEYITRGNRTIYIDKYHLSDFSLKYDAEMLNRTEFHADVFRYNHKRWHMNMVNWNSIKPGSKVIILFHPALWDSF